MIVGSTDEEGSQRRFQAAAVASASRRRGEAALTTALKE